MIQIQLMARISYAGSITEGKLYIPLSQTKTGFLIKGDDNVEIDLYGHFFRVGAIDTESERAMLLPEQKIIQKVIEKESVVTEGIIAKQGGPVVEKKIRKEKKLIPKEPVVEKEIEEVEEIKTEESSINHLIDDEDDF